MGIQAEIIKQLGDFTLNIRLESSAKRIGILGASGCGKSMTLKSIAGIERPDSGRIVLDGRTLYDSGAKIDLKPQKRNVGYMFQNYALFPAMTVEKNIAAGLGRMNGDKAERVREMIERFHLRGLEKHLPGQLSGGQQQRVALARIMAYRPDLILLDEPFSALDQHLKERLQHEMAELLKDYPGQVIMVSHSRDEIYRFSEELLVMDNGRVLAEGETKKLFSDPGTVSVARMTGCKNFSAAQRQDSHTLYLSDWDATLHLEREIPEDTGAIGYRAHFFEPVWGERQENCIPFDPAGADELPFERRYYIRPGGMGENSELICWFVQSGERKQLDSCPPPDYLRMKEEAVMLLKNE